MAGLDSRRKFIGRVASGIAGTLAVPSAVLGAGERLRLGVIGVGERGAQLAREALACGHTEICGFADIYPRRLEMARAIAPAARVHLDYRRLLEDRDIDAVVIATPPHLHARQALAALEAGKHVYVEKTMAFTVEEARLIRDACGRAGGRIVQIGHQACSSGQYADALQFLAADRMGCITAIHAHMYRNTPRGKPQGSRPVYPDMTPDRIAWDAFLGPAPGLAFDANRYVNWRLFWDYSGGNVFESLSQQLAFWYKALDLQIPRAASMLGGVHLWQDGREVPDTMSVAMEHGEGLLFSWDSGLGNSQLGTSEEVLGTHGTLVRGQQIRYLPQKVNLPDGVEALGQTRTPPNAHMRDFLECIRTGKTPNCPVELGYRVSIACRMAVESYRQGRTVRWDPAREEIL
jgi:predicted dehydrogenase